MGLCRLCRLVFLISALVLPSLAAIRPSFNVDFSAWNATDIVMAEVTPVDGDFRVIEALKGDLRTGEHLSVPELRPDSNSLPISEYPDVCEKWEKDPGRISTLIPKQPVGSRIVLFLTRAQDWQTSIDEQHHPARWRPSQAGNSDLSRWKPSDVRDSMQASVVWIGGSNLYAFRQIINPGRPVLCKQSSSETELRLRFLRISRLRREFDAAAALPPSEERAHRLEIFVRSTIFPAKLAALKEIGKSGPDAAPIISGLLDDPNLSEDAGDLIDALIEAGGKSVGKELNDRLADELKFWIAEGPSMQRGWLNGSADHSPLSTNYFTTYELVLGLEKTSYRPALPTLMKVRSVWRSLPLATYDPGSNNEMLSECDKVIRRLRK